RLAGVAAPCLFRAFPPPPPASPPADPCADPERPGWLELRAVAPPVAERKGNRFAWRPRAEGQWPGEVVCGYPSLCQPQPRQQLRRDLPSSDRVPCPERWLLRP